MKPIWKKIVVGWSGSRVCYLKLCAAKEKTGCLHFKWTLAHRSAPCKCVWEILTHKFDYSPTVSIWQYLLALHLQHLLHANDACHAEVFTVLAHLNRLQPFRHRPEGRAVRATGAWKPNRNSKRNTRESQQTTSGYVFFFFSLCIFVSYYRRQALKEKTRLFRQNLIKNKILFAWMHGYSMTFKKSQFSFILTLPPPSFSLLSDLIP